MASSRQWLWRKYRAQKERRRRAYAPGQPHRGAPAARTRPPRRPTIIGGKRFGPFLFDEFSGALDCPETGKFTVLSRSPGSNGAFTLLRELMQRGGKGTYNELCGIAADAALAPAVRGRLMGRVQSLRNKLDILHPNGAAYVSNDIGRGYSLANFRS